MKNTILLIYLLYFLFTSCNNVSVVSLEKVSSLVSQAHAGDTIRIKNGTYRDVQLKIKGKGSLNNPIVIIAEDPGKVVITGNSNLRLSGDHIEINGLLFKDGCSPSGAVIEFRNDQEIANYCRVTNTAIYYFNPTNRNVKNNWVLIYGKCNRFDHNSLIGKLNPDVTLAVILDEPRNCENHHLIEYNYFGVRPILGSNGGETIRVGTSHHALLSSNTMIQNNVFEHCNGEVEIVSIKSSDNLIKNNLFIECQGVLALRHGNRNQVIHNAFIGNEKPYTGGVRVVNEGHLIEDNLFYRLTGKRFFSALSLMNAVPNSLPNRYHQVKDVQIVNNRFICCDHITFGVGLDSERTLAPSNILFEKNTLYQNKMIPVYQALSSTKEYSFKNNVYNYPKHQKLIGFKRDDSIENKIDLTQFVTKKEVGISYNLTDESVKKANGRHLALKNADFERYRIQNNDTIELTDSVYYFNNSLKIKGNLYITSSRDSSQKPVFKYVGTSRAPFVVIENGGSLEIKGVVFDGSLSPGKSLVTGGIESKEGMITPYTLKVYDCEFTNFNESNFAAIRGSKSSFATDVIIQNSKFYSMSGEGINFAQEKDDLGIYNVENLKISNCSFTNMLGCALNIYRGGNDESTSGPYVMIDHCTFDFVNNRDQGSAVRLIGTQIAHIQNCQFLDSGEGGASIRFDEMRWDDLTLSNINLWHSGRISSFWNQLKLKNITFKKPICKS